MKDIIGQSNEKDNEYSNMMDRINNYMRFRKVPSEILQRVHLWMEFTWKTQKTFNEAAMLDSLPLKMKMDVTMDVHFNTLKNVKLFQGCQPGFIRELAVRLKPIIYLPGITKNHLI